MGTGNLAVHSYSKEFIHSFTKHLLVICLEPDLILSRSFCPQSALNLVDWQIHMTIEVISLTIEADTRRNRKDMLKYYSPNSFCSLFFFFFLTPTFFCVSFLEKAHFSLSRKWIRFAFIPPPRPGPPSPPPCPVLAKLLLNAREQRYFLGVI